MSILEIIGITFLPFLELRASIPYGIVTGTPWFTTFFVAVCANIFIGILIFILLHTILNQALKIPILKRIYDASVNRVQHKAEHKIEKYGDWVVAIFIGIPLPGSGVYSGALLAYLLKMSWKKFLRANIIGVLIAGVLVTVVVLTGAEAFDIFLKAYT